MCKNCKPEWLKAIEANRQSLHFKKGEALFHEGDPVTGMYFIYSGVVKVHKKWSDDKELILRFAKKGAIVGHRGLGNDTIYPITATALTATDICFVDLDFFAVVALQVEFAEAKFIAADAGGCCALVTEFAEGVGERFLLRADHADAGVVEIISRHRVLDTSGGGAA